MLNYIEKYCSKEPRFLTRILQNGELSETCNTLKKTAVRYFVCSCIQLIDVNIPAEKFRTLFSVACNRMCKKFSFYCRKIMKMDVF